jgi:hypothetical protein
MNNFIYNNEDFVKQNGFFDGLRRFYQLTHHTSRIISQESMFFLMYLQLEADAYPDAVQ